MIAPLENITVFMLVAAVAIAATPYATAGGGMDPLLGTVSKENAGLPAGDALTVAATHPAVIELTDGIGIPETPTADALVIQKNGDLHLVEDILLPDAAGLPDMDGTNIWIHVEGALHLHPGVTIQAASGSEGADAMATGKAVAGHGGTGGSVFIQAGTVIANGNLVRAGNGGAGGAALAVGDPDAYAWGGDGGTGGVVMVQTVYGVIGDLWVRGGDAGAGGSAEASGADRECSSKDGSDEEREGTDGEPGDENGTDARANGGDGTCGPVDGRGGQGGGAFAYAGHGADGIQGEPGDGGDAVAVAGQPGRGSDACFSSNEEAEDSGIQHAGHAGFLGEFEAIGGDGGDAITPVVSGFSGGTGGFGIGESHGSPGGNHTLPILWGEGSGSREDGVYDAQGGDGGDSWATGGTGGSAAANVTGGTRGSGCWADGDVGTLPNPGIAGLMLVLLLAFTFRLARFRSQG